MSIQGYHILCHLVLLCKGPLYQEKEEMYAHEEKKGFCADWDLEK